MADFLRLHVDLLDNPKIQNLPSDLVRPWLNFLVLARLNGGYVPPIETAAFRLRLPPAEVAALLGRLRLARLMDDTPEGWRPHDWEEWNPPHPKDRTGAERQRRWRQNHPRVVNNELRNTHNAQSLRNTVTPLYVSSTVCMSDSQSDGNALHNTRLDAEWPETSWAVREHFEACDDTVVLAVVEACQRAFISARNGANLPDLTDSQIADAVRKSYFEGQQYVQAFAKRAPNVIKTWVLELQREQRQQLTQ